MHWIAAGLTQKQAHVFVDGLAALIEPVKTHYLWRPMSCSGQVEKCLVLMMNLLINNIPNWKATFSEHRNRILAHQGFSNMAIMLNPNLSVAGK
ncbi:hypothetical protein V2H77_16040 [Photorhabdus sp. P32]|uniref:hypothetical protein n=1 Tax=Photorhabdus sp. P32 TaxID=3117549 RepID=UPI00311AC59B